MAGTIARMLGRAWAVGFEWGPPVYWLPRAETYLGDDGRFYRAVWLLWMVTVWRAARPEETTDDR